MREIRCSATVGGARGRGIDVHHHFDVIGIALVDVLVQCWWWRWRRHSQVLKLRKHDGSILRIGFHNYDMLVGVAVDRFVNAVDCRLKSVNVLLLWRRNLSNVTSTT